VDVIRAQTISGYLDPSRRAIAIAISGIPR
jgi:hypothetical protein